MDTEIEYIEAIVWHLSLVAWKSDDCMKSSLSGVNIFASNHYFSEDMLVTVRDLIYLDNFLQRQAVLFSLFLNFPPVNPVRAFAPIITWPTFGSPKLFSDLDAKMLSVQKSKTKKKCRVFRPLCIFVYS